MRSLQAALETPICLDECIRSAHQAEQAIRMGACRIINIKLGRVGGFTGAKRVHDVAHAANRCPCGAVACSSAGIGRAHNVALSTLPGFVLPGDVSASQRYWARDIIHASRGSDAARHHRSARSARVRLRPGLRIHPRNHGSRGDDHLTAAGVRPSRAQLYSLLGVMLLFWSANFIFAKLAVRELPALLVVCFRTVLSGLFMLPVYAFAQDRVEHGVRKWTRRDMPILIAVGVLGVIGNQLLWVVGLSMTSVAHGAVITATGPMFVLSVLRSAGHERMTIRKLGGMLIASTGVAVLQIGRAGSGGATSAVT